MYATAGDGPGQSREVDAALAGWRQAESALISTVAPLADFFTVTWAESSTNANERASSQRTSALKHLRRYITRQALAYKRVQCNAAG